MSARRTGPTGRAGGCDRADLGESDVVSTLRPWRDEVLGELLADVESGLTDRLGVSRPCLDRIHGAHSRSVTPASSRVVEVEIRIRRTAT